ncbi:leucine-rich repeat neuronal protein 4 [Ambystoma mexicanum]|uniref:leucine-rich repeat neuronal protein 4 n=1 Tax=Ambystoma mexicanum TaxID=8296 RepID=UPI0037E6FEF4
MQFLVLLPVTLIVWRLGAGTADDADIFSTDGHGHLFKLIKLQDTTVKTNESSCEDVNNTTVIELNVTHSRLTALPACLPRTLKALNLSYNNLSVIDYHKMAELAELRTLTLSHNSIEELNCTGKAYGSLEILDLSYNLLHSVPKCQGLPKLQWLSLAGNPLQAIGPLAFSCFPHLAFLNLSTTLLGFGAEDSIRESAFAVKAADGDITEKPMEDLTELDLSYTFLTHIQQEWTKDLPNLRRLYLSQMPNLECLNFEAFKHMLQIEELNCQGSRSLSRIESQIFEHTPHLKLLDFGNCNLSSFNHWYKNSSTLQTIILTGNPLSCSCELSWLLSKTNDILLLRENETICYRTEHNGSLSLPDLYKECEPVRNSTLNLSAKNATRAPTSTEAGSNALVELYSDIANTLSSTETALQTHHSTTGVQDISTFTSTTNASRRGPTALPALPYEAFTHLPSSTRTTGTEAKEQNATQVNTIKKHPTVPHIPREYMPEMDYEDEEEEEAASPYKITVCDYHPCKHLQKPCHEIQRVSSCYCPGLSADNVLPDPPRLKEVSEITDTSVQIHWCAPNSIVHRYQLAYHPDGSEDPTVVDDLYVTARQYTLYNLLPDTTYQVCMVAVNKAGSSQVISSPASRIPCTKFKTRPSYIVILAALCATCGILLLIIVVLSVCLHRKRKSTFADVYDTHLVSYKNPSFDYQLKMQAFN